MSDQEPSDRVDGTPRWVFLLSGLVFTLFGLIAAVSLFGQPSDAETWAAVIFVLMSAFGVAGACFYQFACLGQIKSDDS